MSNKILIAIICALILAFGGFFAYKMLQANKTVKNETSSQEIQKEQTPAQENQIAQTPSEQTTASTTKAATGECVRNFDENKFKTEKMEIQNRQVEIDVKNFGKIILSLDAAAAPKTVENFLKLTDSGFYNCLTFHRIAKDFVIQGGDPKGDGTGGPGFTIPAEIKLLHKKGSIAMARLGDQVNPNKESSGSQFYIALNDLPMLDGQYTVFGQVIEGMDVVEKIGQTPIDSPSGDGAPIDKIIMDSVRIIK